MSAVEKVPCATEPGDLWFGAENEKQNTRRDREALARAGCARCPNAGPCLDGALELGEKHGIWGGVRFSTFGPERTHLLEVGRHELVASMGHVHRKGIGAKGRVPVGEWAFDHLGCRCTGCAEAKALADDRRRGLALLARITPSERTPA